MFRGTCRSQCEVESSHPLCRARDRVWQVTGDGLLGFIWGDMVVKAEGELYQQEMRFFCAFRMYTDVMTTGIEV